MWRVTVADEDHVLESCLGLDLVDDRCEVFVDETDRAARVLEDVGEFLRSEPEVERVDHAAAEQGRVEEHEILGGVRHHHCEPIAAADAEPLQSADRPGHLVEVLA